MIVDKGTTTIIEGAGKRADIKGRIAQIEQEHDKSTSDYDREKLQERKAKLAGGVAKISVGGATESEVKEKKLRFEDALNATRAAVEEGILAGGGVALLRAAAACKPEGLNQDEQAGYKIVQRACRSPLTWIAQNAGKHGRLVCEKVIEGKGNFGYNAVKDCYEDLVESGVIDPTKVVRTALKNAASVAALLLTSDALIAEKPKEQSMSTGHGDDRRQRVLEQGDHAGRHDVQQDIDAQPGQPPPRAPQQGHEILTYPQRTLGLPTPRPDSGEWREVKRQRSSLEFTL